MKSSPHMRALLATVVVFATGGLPVVASTAWTGAESAAWSHEANWTDEVPGSGTEAVFAAVGASNLVVDLPAEHLEIGSFRFHSNIPSGVSLVRASGNANILFSTAGTVIAVESGSGPVTLQTRNGTEAAGGAFSFSPGQTYAIVNQSGSTLSLNGNFARNGSSGLSTVQFNGSGAIAVLNYSRWVSSFGNWSLQAGMTGSVSFGSKTTIDNQGVIDINGGTLVLDGTLTSRPTSFTVGEAMLTGNGSIGTGSTRNIKVAFNHGAVIDPGRVREVGELTFFNNDVVLNEGATLRLDLQSIDSHDRLLFDVEASRSIEVFLPTGVALELNLLEGFTASLNETFSILEGYDALHGTFEGLPDGGRLFAGRHEFQIFYGDHQTYLQVVAIPEPSQWALFMSALSIPALAFARRRRSRLG